LLAVLLRLVQVGAQVVIHFAPVHVHLLALHLDLLLRLHVVAAEITSS
jgi:hypothetical protein